MLIFYFQLSKLPCYHISLSHRPVSRFVEFVTHIRGSTCQVSHTKSLHIFNRHFFVMVGVESVEERVYVFFLRVVGRVKYSIGVCKDGHGLCEVIFTFTGSIAPVLSLS